MKDIIKHYANQFTPNDHNSNIRRVKQYEPIKTYQGFKVYQADANPRLKKVELSKDIVQTFLNKINKITVTDLEYVAFKRFFLSHVMDELTDGQLSAVTKSILNDRKSGAFILSVEDFHPDVEKEFKQMLQISTAVSFMFGKANLDSMSGLFYARFAVELKDNSDSYLRKFQDRMTLHNDGTFVNELTDYVLMTKLAERDVQGGHSLLLHLDDWEDLDAFYQHHLSSKSIKFSAPPSKNVHYNVHHPIFHTDKEGRPCMAYIDQFVKPANSEEGMYLYALGQSLESSKAVLGFELSVGCSVICNNHFWLHGRDKFAPTQGLYRELMRQRGVFFENLVRQPYPDSVESC